MTPSEPPPRCGSAQRVCGGSAGVASHPDVPTLVASIVIGLFVFAGTLLCVIPGLVVAAMYKFTYLFIVDKRMDFGRPCRPATPWSSATTPASRDRKSTRP